MGSPENRRTPAVSSQGVTFHNQQYSNLPNHIVAGIQRVQTLEQASMRARGSSHNQRGGSVPRVGHHKL